MTTYIILAVILTFIQLCFLLVALLLLAATLRVPTDTPVAVHAGAESDTDPTQRAFDAWDGRWPPWEVK